MTFLFYVPQMAAYGGMERHVCLLAHLLAGCDHAVTMLTTSNSLNDTDRTELLRSGVELREMPAARGSASNWMKFAWLCLNVIRLRARSWDVIYSNGQSGLARTTWLARGRETRIAHHHHTAGDAEEQKTWHPAFLRTLAAAPELVACSETTKRHLETALRRQDAVFLPYLTSEIISTSNVTERSYSSDATLDFGFAGRLTSTKGIERICALSQEPMLRGIRWHIHGRGKEYPASFFYSYSNVKYHGPYNGATGCADVIQSLDALALFSTHNEGMPLSIIEAMAGGLPWIATDQGGTHELAIAVENAEIVPARASFEEIRHSLLKLTDRMRTGKTSRIVQRRVYDNNFSPRIVAERWLEFFGCPRSRLVRVHPKSAMS